MNPNESAQVQAGETQAVYFDGVDYEGRPTRVFAWMGIPAGASVDAPVPAMVLVHGGGGTAYRQWVDEWTQRGYAAISIAVEGQTSTQATEDERASGQAVGSWRTHAMSGPSRIGAYGDTGRPLGDQWMYHAVSATSLAGELMRAFQV